MIHRASVKISEGKICLKIYIWSLRLTEFEPSKPVDADDQFLRYQKHRPPRGSS